MPFSNSGNGFGFLAEHSDESITALFLALLLRSPIKLNYRFVD
jgi:hypothetical protein